MVYTRENLPTEVCSSVVIGPCGIGPDSGGPPSKSLQLSKEEEALFDDDDDGDDDLDDDELDDLESKLKSSKI